MGKANRQQNPSPADQEQPAVPVFPATPPTMLDEPAPTFTIGADSRFGLLCMFLIQRTAQSDAGLSEAERRAIDDSARLFEIYEEALRTEGQ